MKSYDFHTHGSVSHSVSLCITHARLVRVRAERRRPEPALSSSKMPGSILLMATAAVSNTVSATSAHNKGPDQSLPHQLKLCDVPSGRW